MRNSSGAETLSGEDADFDFGLIEPTSVSWCVVTRDRPQTSAPVSSPSKSVSDLRQVDVQVVHHRSYVSRTSSILLM
jgi:hypothetical protein